MKPEHKKWASHKIRAGHVLVLLTLGLGASMSIAQQSKDSLPTVITASVPFYPPAARVAGIEGVVRLRLSTDGKSVSAVSSQTGPPALIRAAEENVRTWKFKEHSPATFDATFQYKLLPEADCGIDDGTVLLRLPTEVEVIAKRVKTCDPILEEKPR